MAPLAQRHDGTRRGITQEGHQEYCWRIQRDQAKYQHDQEDDHERDAAAKIDALKAVVGKVDVDSNQEFAAKYGVRNIPTVLFIKAGEVSDKSVGAVPKAQLQQKLDALL